MKKLLVLTMTFGMMLLYACGGGEQKPIPGTEPKDGATAEAGSENPPYDPERGVGKFKDVQIPATLDASLADAGEKVFNLKCASCHKLTDEKLVGPGWKGVTQR